MKNPKFQIFVGTNDQFYFRLIAANGEKILGSEGYTAKLSCQNGTASVKVNAPLDQRYQRKTASNGQFYFTLIAANNEPIGNSEMYTTEDARDNGIEAVKKTAPDANVEDIS
ncbi:MAG: YegP family protein [Desulfobacteraceae bacterium]|nr:YegP family protein [Desulfobacteraceae bacterium]